ncbi:hypothetical protein A6R68_04867, partial [Neotoma lepida]
VENLLQTSLLEEQLKSPKQAHNLDFCCPPFNIAQTNIKASGADSHSTLMKCLSEVFEAKPQIDFCPRLLLPQEAPIFSEADLPLDTQLSIELLSQNEMSSLPKRDYQLWNVDIIER